MGDEKETPPSPLKRISQFWKLTMGTVGGALAMMGMDLVGRLLAKTNKPMEEYVPLLGAFIGATLAAGDHDKESEKEKALLASKNVFLQSQIDELKNDKSFVQAVVQEKLEKSTEAPVRSQ